MRRFLSILVCAFCVMQSYDAVAKKSTEATFKNLVKHQESTNKDKWLPRHVYNMINCDKVSEQALSCLIDSDTFSRLRREILLNRGTPRYSQLALVYHCAADFMDTCNIQNDEALNQCAKIIVCAISGSCTDTGGGCTRNNITSSTSELDLVDWMTNFYQVEKEQESD